jgi:ribosomal-protein-alanine N-acetyltransferase
MESDAEDIPMAETIYKGNPDLETERLLLRRLRKEDAEAVFAYASDPEVSRYMTWDTHASIEESHRFIEAKLAQYAKDEAGEWGIVWKETGRLVGAMGIASISMTNQRAEIGYVLARPWWGKGIMPEAVRRLLCFLYEEVGLNRVEAFHFLPNEASGRVMQKAGMRFEGVARERYLAKGRYWDAKQYAITRRDWLNL